MNPHDVRIGMRVWWHDPDADLCSCHGVVSEVRDEVVSLLKSDGVELEVLAGELSVMTE